MRTCRRRRSAVLIAALSLSCAALSAAVSAPSSSTNSGGGPITSDLTTVSGAKQSARGRDDRIEGKGRYNLGLGRLSRRIGESSSADGSEMKKKSAEGDNDGPNAVPASPPPSADTSALPPPESVRLRPRVVTLNVMVAGLSGLGKTTSCAALFEAWRGPPSDDNASRSHRKKGRNTDDHKMTTVVDPSRCFERYDPSANTILRVRIIDTPGFGNRVDHRHAVHPIARYVAGCRERQYRAETSPSMPDADAEGTDELVHVCLYFLGPGRFLEIDRHFLRKIQREVAVVPVIAKADTLTDEEISRYRAELRHAFDRERIEAYDFDGAEYTNRSGRRPGMGLGQVRRGKKIAQPAPPLRRGRRMGEPLAIVSRDGLYPWGVSRAYDPDHSDLGLVRDLLLSEHTEVLVELAREKYGVYRARRIRWGRAGEAVRFALLAGLLFRGAAGSVTGRRRCGGGVGVGGGVGGTVLADISCMVRGIVRNVLTWMVGTSGDMTDGTAVDKDEEKTAKGVALIPPNSSEDDDDSDSEKDSQTEAQSQKTKPKEDPPASAFPRRGSLFGLPI